MNINKFGFTRKNDEGDLTDPLLYESEQELLRDEYESPDDDGRQQGKRRRGQSRKKKASAAGPEGAGQDEKKENAAAGIVGGLLGSLIGVVVIVLLGQLGYIAVISGLIMGFCTLKGYEKLGGRLSKKGIVLSVIIMIIMVWIGTRLDWAIYLQREVFTEETPFTVFAYLDAALEQLSAEGEDVFRSYYAELAEQYLFSALGAVYVIFNTVRGNGKKGGKAGGQSGRS